MIVWILENRDLFTSAIIFILFLVYIVSNKIKRGNWEGDKNEKG